MLSITVDGAGGVVREQPQTRHSAILSAKKPPSLNSSLSHSTELSVTCDSEQSKPSSVISSAVGLDTPPDSPYCVSASHGVSGSRKVTPSPNNVRMGVSAMQRRPVEPEKSKIEARSLVYFPLVMLVLVSV